MLDVADDDGALRAGAGHVSMSTPSDARADGPRERPSGADARGRRRRGCGIHRDDRSRTGSTGGVGGAASTTVARGDGVGCAGSPGATNRANGVPTWTVWPIGTSSSRPCLPASIRPRPRPWWSPPPRRPGHGSRVAGLDEPFVEGSLVHVGAERRHLELDHQRLAEQDSARRRRSFPVCGSAACSRCLA